MKVLVGVSRIFVGVLFIISGLIKLNDPVGFSFKLGDYFAPEVLNLPFLEPYALVIALLVVILEVLLGVMLIVGYAKKIHPMEFTSNDCVFHFPYFLLCIF
jgi:uncharacterized membrane protein YphA (DoxX/SURF4 family)